MGTRLNQIISGGQTGVDRAALDAALKFNFSCGGWCTATRKAEDGEIPNKYPLVALTSDSYLIRTEKNVLDSDATLIFYFARLKGGTKKTQLYCQQHCKPTVLINAERTSSKHCAATIREFLEQNEIRILNVAGPRLSHWPGGYEFAYSALTSYLEKFLTAKAPDT